MELFDGKSDEGEAAAGSGWDFSVICFTPSWRELVLSSGKLEFLSSGMCLVGRAEGSEVKEHKTAQAVRRESWFWINSESPWAKRVWQYLGTFRVKMSKGQTPRGPLFTGNVGNPLYQISQLCL